MTAGTKTFSVCLFCRSSPALWKKGTSLNFLTPGEHISGRRSIMATRDKIKRMYGSKALDPTTWQHSTTLKGRSSPWIRRGKYDSKKYQFTNRFVLHKETGERRSNRRPLELKASHEPMEQVARRILARMQRRIHDEVFQRETNLQDEDAEERFAEFERSIAKALEENPKTQALSTMRQSLIDAYNTKEEAGLQVRLKYVLQAKLANAKFVQSDIINQLKLADLRYPSEWFPMARRLNRTIHLHIGPTNSGKTYHALQRLEQAESGCYAGPLRLLAHEVYTRLNAKGKKCSLLTGDEIILPEADEEEVIAACTVEMVPFGRNIDVAVIDEIQMIADSSRGWAWTQAVIGVRAKELHLCGETRSLQLIQQIAASLGEKLIIHNYERLSPLAVAKQGLNSDLTQLQKGDCVVSFSRKVLHALKKNIESSMGKNVAIVYGALPPEIRAQQAQLFNDQDNDYDVLVASDAIGMGLNLSVKRIVFETLEKWNGTNQVNVTIPQIKQIGGRAGRYRTAAQDNVANASALTTTINEILPPKTEPTKTLGLVTTLHNVDLPRLRRAMDADPPPIPSAGLKPPDTVILRFSSYFPPGTPFSYILLRLHEICRIHPRYFLCDLHDQVGIADTIQPVSNLTISERMMLCYAPADTKNEHIASALVAFAKCIASRSGGGILDVKEIPLEILDQELPSARKAKEMEEYIMALATAHQIVVLYLWLSYRMTNVFHQQALAFYTKGLLQEKLDKALGAANLDKGWLKNRFQRSMKSRQEAESHEKQQQQEQEEEKIETESDIATGTQSKTHGQDEIIAIDDEGNPAPADELQADLAMEQQQQDEEEFGIEKEEDKDKPSRLRNRFLPSVTDLGRRESSDSATSSS